MVMANKAAFLSSYKSHRYACNFIVTGKLCLLWWLWTSVYDQRGACNVPYLAGNLTACTGNVRLEIQGQEQMEGDRKHKNVCNTSWPCRVLRTINNTTFTQVYLSRFLYWIEIHLCLYASSYVNVLQFHKTLNQGNKGQYHKLFTIQ